MAKFYKDKNGNVISVPFVDDVEIADFEELIPGSTDGAGEKHVPFVETGDNEIKIKVGEVAHPMMDEHWINNIYLETDKGFYTKNLNPGEEPEAIFILDENENPVAAYEYCNLHGLWEKKF